MRHSMLKTLYESNGSKIKYYNIPWNEFPFLSGYKKHNISDREKLRPNLISEKYYQGDSSYTDIILFINNILDSWNIPDGKEIRIPDLNELKNWISSYRSRLT